MNKCLDLADGKQDDGNRVCNSFAYRHVGRLNPI